MSTTVVPGGDEGRGGAGGARRLTLTIAPTVQGLAEAQAQLSAFLQGAALPDKLVGRADLLLEEMMMNVIKHGHIADPAAARVTLEAVTGPGVSCRLVFEDPGAEFDPTKPTLPLAAARLEEAPVGGLGLVLLRRMARDLAYARLPEGRNRLTLTLTAE